MRLLIAQMGDATPREDRYAAGVEAAPGFDEADVVVAVWPDGYATTVKGQLDDLAVAVKP